MRFYQTILGGLAFASACCPSSQTSASTALSSKKSDLSPTLPAHFRGHEISPQGLHWTALQTEPAEIRHLRERRQARQKFHEEHDPASMLQGAQLFEEKRDPNIVPSAPLLVTAPPNDGGVVRLSAVSSATFLLGLVLGGTVVTGIWAIYANCRRREAALPLAISPPLSVKTTVDVDILRPITLGERVPSTPKLADITAPTYVEPKELPLTLILPSTVVNQQATLQVAPRSSYDRMPTPVDQIDSDAEADMEIGAPDLAPLPNPLEMQNISQRIRHHSESSGSGYGSLPHSLDTPAELPDEPIYIASSEVQGPENSYIRMVGEAYLELREAPTVVRLGKSSSLPPVARRNYEDVQKFDAENQYLSMRSLNGPLVPEPIYKNVSVSSFKITP